MQVNLPPVLFYAIGAMLMVFGALRIKYLGAPRARRRPVDDETWGESSVGATSEEQLERRPEQRRHIRWGIIWILLGLFLVISTIVQVRRH
jgi:hypothetical protein